MYWPEVPDESPSALDVGVSCVYKTRPAWAHSWSISTTYCATDVMLFREIWRGQEMELSGHTLKARWGRG